MSVWSEYDGVFKCCCFYNIVSGKKRDKSENKKSKNPKLKRKAGVRETDREEGRDKKNGALCRVVMDAAVAWPGIDLGMDACQQTNQTEEIGSSRAIDWLPWQQQVVMISKCLSSSATLACHRECYSVTCLNCLCHVFSLMTRQTIKEQFIGILSNILIISGLEKCPFFWRALTNCVYCRVFVYVP